MIFDNLIELSDDEIQKAKIEAIVDTLKESDSIDDKLLANAFEKHIEKTQERP